MIAPVTSLRFTVEYPVVTITSSRAFPGCKEMFKLSLSALTTALVYPTKLTSKAAPSATSMVKFPSKSLLTPLLVPCSITVAPGSGKPLSSVTTPDTVFCANPLNAISTKAEVKSNSFFMLIDIVLSHNIKNILPPTMSFHKKTRLLAGF